MITAEKVRLSWASIGKKVNDLIDLLENKEFDRVVGISRGGLPLGVALSHRLNLPFSVVGVSSYNNDTNEQETLVCDTPDIVFKGWEGSVLVCDDIADSGRTLQFLDSKIKKNPKVSNITTVTFYYKECSVVKPDIYLEVTDKWIVFPWEY